MASSSLMDVDGLWRYLKEEASQGAERKMSETQPITYVRSLSKEEGSMARSNSKDSGIDRDYSLSSSRETDGDVRRLSTDVRRDSSGSNDSNASKKQAASLNEIQDLYSALHDLVKTNVTATPVAIRSQNFLTSTPDELTKTSPRNSPKLRPTETLRLNELTTLIIDPKEGKLTQRATSSTALGVSKKEQMLTHKRGHSAGNVEAMKMKNSPLARRRQSNDSELTDTDDDKHVKKTARSASACEKVKKESKLLRNSSNKSEGKSNKRWKPKIFSRLRSKSIHGNEENENEEEKCSSDVSYTPPLQEKNRRLSEADVKKMEKKAVKEKSSKPKPNNSCPPVRKKFDTSKQTKESTDLLSSVCDENVKDMKQLVESLNTDYSNENTSSKSYELDELSSWFEKAAAEAVLNQSRMDLTNGDETKRRQSDVVDSRRKSSGKKVATVKRGNSTGRNDRRQLRKTACKNKDNNLRVNALGTMHARSTPNLRDYENDDYSDCDSPSYETKQQDDVLNKSARSICLDDKKHRLPKTPLFYSPDNDLTSQNTLQIVNPNKFFDTDVFYTDESHTPTLKSRVNESNSITSAEKDEKRPKSMFALGNYIEFQIDTTKLQTDDNANFCETSSNVNLNTNGLVNNQNAIMT